MEIDFDIDESIEEARNIPEIIPRCEAYRNLLTRISETDTTSNEILNQLEKISFDLSEIAKKNRVLNMYDIMDGNKLIRGLINDSKKKRSDNKMLLGDRDKMKLFVEKYARSVNFMIKDLVDIKNHPTHTSITPILCIFALLFIAVLVLFLNSNHF